MDRKQDAPILSLSWLLLISAMLLAACGAGDQITNAGTRTGDSAEAAAVLARSGPFNAVATSAISVNLAWEPVDGATGYRVENQFGESEWFDLAELGADATAYEDFPAPSNMELNYRLTPLLASGESKALMTTVTTPVVAPNPYSVKVTLEEPDYSNVGLNIPGFDPSTFDPATFDPSSLDLSGFNAENLDLSSLGPKPVSAVALIGPEGGNFSVTGKNGITYTLDIPPQALDFATYFTLTPVAEIESYPFSGGYYGAVQITPEGIVFDTPVTITFTFPEGIGPSTTLEKGLLPVAFAFERGGAEFHLRPYANLEAEMGGIPGEAGGRLASPARQAQQSMVVSTDVSKSVGAGNATGAEAHDQASMQSPTNPADAAAQEKAAGDLQPPTDDTQDSKRQEAMRKGAQIESCIKGAASLSALTQCLHIDFMSFFASEAFQRLLPEEQAHMFETAAIVLYNWLEPTKCPSPDADLTLMWARRLRRPVNPFDQNLQKHMAMAYPVEMAANLGLIEAVRGCTVKLTLGSTVTVMHSTPDSICRYEVTVTAEVPLSMKFDGRKAFLQGGAADADGKTAPNLQYKLPIKILSSRADGKGEWCNEVKYSSLDQSTFTVVRLEPVYDVGNEFRLKDWRLIWTGAGAVTEGSLQFVDKDGNTGSAGAYGATGGDLWGGMMVGMAPPGSGKGIGWEHWSLVQQYEGESTEGSLALWDPTGTQDGALIAGDTKITHDTQLYLDTQ